MAHYAFLDDNSIVTEVITGIDETELIEGLDTETWYGNFRGQKCVRTSYNSNIRYNYAAIGYTYDVEGDAFIAPRPECGHKELFLNHLYRWTCQGCDLEAKKLLDEA
jgi:ribosomal protein S27AE